MKRLSASGKAPAKDVAGLLGAALLGEPLAPLDGVALAVIPLGLWLATRV